MKRIFKYIIVFLICILAILISLPVLLYIPTIQNWIKNIATEYISTNMGMQISIERIRLSFPLDLVIEHSQVITEQGDTLLHSEELHLDIALKPLLKKQVKVNQFSFKNTQFSYSDSTSQFKISGDIQHFILSVNSANLVTEEAKIPRIILKGGQVNLSLGESEPDTLKSESTPIKWIFDVRKLALTDIIFTMQMSEPQTDLCVKIKNALLKQGLIDLGKQTVDVNSLLIEQGQYSYLADTARYNKTQSDIPDKASLPWTVQANHIKLTDNQATYGLPNHIPEPGLDLNYISANNINMLIDSLYNRGSKIEANLKHLSLNERSGISIIQSNGIFFMDSVQLSLQKFALKTYTSDIRAKANIGMSISEMAPSTPLSFLLDAQIGIADIYALYPSIKKELKLLPVEKLIANADITGTLGKVKIKEININFPGHAVLTSNGNLNSITQPEKMSGDFKWQGNFNHLDFVKTLLPDTALRNRIKIPNNIKLNGQISIAGQNYRPDMYLITDNGKISLSGLINPKREVYDMALLIDSFSVKSFLPKDSLGLLSVKAKAKGKGFDFLSEKTFTNALININQAEYNGYNYENIELKASLNKQILSGALSCNAEALDIDLEINGVLSPNLIQAHIFGPVNQLNLEKMHFSSSPLSMGMHLDIEGSTDQKDKYSANVNIKDFILRMNSKENKLKQITLNTNVDKDFIHGKFAADNISVRFDSPVGIDILTKGIENTQQLLEKQLQEWQFNLASLEQQLPPFSFSAQASKNDFLKSILEPAGIDFKQAGVEVESSEKRPFHIKADIDQLVKSGIQIDTIRMYARQGRDSSKIVYHLHIGNVPGNLDQAAQVGMSGYIESNHMLMRCKQKNRSGEQGFNFGYEAWLQDSLVRISFLPDPILGFEPWTVNKNNFIEYFFDNSLDADLTMKAAGKNIILQPADKNIYKKGALNIKIDGLDIASLLSVSPFAPPLGGIFSTNMNLYLPQQQVDVQGSIGISDMNYNKQRIGDINLGVYYKLDSINRQQVNADLIINETKALTISGNYDTNDKNSIGVTVDIPSLPLETVNPFLSGMAGLQGSLKGNMKITGNTDSPLINGYLQLMSTSVNVPMIGTSFGFSSDQLKIVDNQILFQKYSINGPNKQPLVINGNVDFQEFSHILTNLSITATEFQLVNVSKNNKSMVYGKAFSDLDLTVNGAVDELRLRGNIGLLNGTDVTYVMQDSPLDIKQETQNMVTFVSFNDTTVVEEDSIPVSRIGGMDILVNVNIASAVKLAVNLSADGKNRINLQGGGNLSYSMNSLGDSRFTGRYELTGGTVRYSPPIIAEKSFNIQQGSYVSWSGNIADPNMNITAIDPLRINVTEDDKTSRPVTFDVSINIKNSLENLAITFDVSAPQDLTIQNELMALTAEQRATQAMNLLIYNTYSGPGSSSSKIATGNPLNSFITKELNQWAQNNLKNIDVSFGIDSYDDGTPGGTGTHTDYSYQVSKTLFNDRFKVVIGGSFSPDDNTNQNLKENLIDDVSLEYMLDKRENMLIKLFHHTGYESILEGEITQTGVGFVVRKKLFKLSELFRISSRKSKNTEK